MTINEISRWLADLLNLDAFAAADPSLNGLQVGRGSKEAARAAFAVDACADTFARGVEAGADLLVVHHGLFWGVPRPLTRGLYDRLALLVRGDMGLFAAHLPLDAHPELGHNAVMAARLGLEDRQPFGLFRGLPIGCRGVLETPLDLDAALERLGIGRRECAAVLPFGPETIRTAAIVSGAAAEDAEQAAEAGVDLFITGEAAHQIYHPCLEAGIHFVAAGHYFTETFGLQALARKMAGDLGLETVFLDSPTGL